jgi:hypothetical protein
MTNLVSFGKLEKMKKNEIDQIKRKRRITKSYFEIERGVPRKLRFFGVENPLVGVFGLKILTRAGEMRGVFLFVVVNIVSIKIIFNSKFGQVQIQTNNTNESLKMIENFNHKRILRVQYSQHNEVDNLF